MVGLGDCALFLTHRNIYLRVAKEGGEICYFPLHLYFDLYFYMTYLRVAKEGGGVEVVAPVPARHGPLPVEQGLAPGLLDATFPWGGANLTSGG